MLLLYKEKNKPRKFGQLKDTIDTAANFNNEDTVANQIFIGNQI